MRPQLVDDALVVGQELLGVRHARIVPRRSGAGAAGSVEADGVVRRSAAVSAGARRRRPRRPGSRRRPAQHEPAGVVERRRDRLDSHAAREQGADGPPEGHAARRRTPRAGRRAGRHPTRAARQVAPSQVVEHVDHEHSRLTSAPSSRVDVARGTGSSSASRSTLRPMPTTTAAPDPLDEEAAELARPGAAVAGVAVDHDVVGPLERGVHALARRARRPRRPRRAAGASPRSPRARSGAARPTSRGRRRTATPRCGRGGRGPRSARRRRR